ncbi:UNVERIFIED_CONTAM: hypothetical protein FKN15_007063 [Acipenser sinensis]
MQTRSLHGVTRVLYDKGLVIAMYLSTLMQANEAMETLLRTETMYPKILQVTDS